MKELGRNTCALVILGAALIALGVLSGCHGGSEAVGGRTGRMTVTLVWPEPVPGDLQPRLIPSQCRSVQLMLTHSETEIGRELLVRPASPPWATVASFDPVPTGVLAVKAVAYPNTDATGVAQAAGEMLVTVLPGQAAYPSGGSPGDPVTLVLGSTIATVEVTPNPVSVGASLSVQLTATSKDDEGRTVLVPTNSPYTWAVISGTEFATVDSTGRVTGNAAGTATVRAIERESSTSGAANVTVLPVEGGYMFVGKWGGSGSTDGKFGNTQIGLTVDSTGNLWVVDTFNHRLQKFTNTGTFLGKWGTQGAADGQFEYPRDVVADAAGKLYVTDSNNHRVQVFSSTGQFLAKWGAYGGGDGQMSGPMGIDLDSVGNVYVVDRGNNRVQKFGNTGTFLTRWGSDGVGDGQFDYPWGLCVHKSTGAVYVLDVRNYRVQKFTTTGSFTIKWGSQGSGDGQLDIYHSRFLDVDAQGNVYVPDRDNHRVQKFGSDGAFLAKWGSYGTADGQFEYPEAVAVDADGAVYVSSNYFIHKFVPLRGDIGVIID